MKKFKTLIAIGLGFWFGLILGWAMLLPQYFPYETLIKLYHSIV